MEPRPAPRAGYKSRCLCNGELPKWRRFALLLLGQTSVGAIIIITSPFVSSFPLTKFVSSGQQSFGYDGNGNWPRLFLVYHRVAGILWVMGTRSDGMTGGSSYLTHVPAPLTYTVPVAFRLFAFDWFRSFFVFHDSRRKVEVSNQLMSLSFICYLFCTSAPPTK